MPEAKIFLADPMALVFTGAPVPSRPGMTLLRSAVKRAVSCMLGFCPVPRAALSRRVSARFTAVLFLLLVAAVCSACSAVYGDEPTDAALREKLEGHRESLDELRRLFEDDMKRGLIIVAAKDGWSRCEDRRNAEQCLSRDRWGEYAKRLTTAGVVQMGRQEAAYLERIGQQGTPGIYFHVYRTPSWSLLCNCFRFRGLVYAPGVPKVEHKTDDYETRVDLGGGWYSYVIIDS